ncbi:MAG: gliding motility-associated ABC transporter substrate-binding protein GldG [Bacteroidales bacterium]|nr:gliding motility-associated ABC transporter substrate-binding protein GldG [Bacteroidales bacterium]
MFTLYKKELSGFFSSLIGYLTIAVFLVLTGLMLWVLKSDFNILDYGYAGMDGLFLIGPFLYLFLIPAITMRSLAEERRAGTIEMLMTRPLSDWTIVWAKFLASWTLVFISLLPTLVCYVSVYALGDPIGNIDTGSVVGSYIGLLLLGGAFVAIGLFCSSLTNNQIVSFILAAVLCAVTYLGFESIYNMGLLGSADLFIKRLGLMHHYGSISRGVVDTRDVVYFLCVMALFLMATRMVLQSRKWGGWTKRKSLKRSHWIEMGVTIAIIAAVSVISNFLFLRLDLTSERRYTLSKSTKQWLKQIEEPVLFRVYLEGEFPSDFKRLQNETKEMLNQFRAYNSNIEYEFVNPNNFESREEQQVFYQKLARKGIQPTQIQVASGNGMTTQILIPAADVYYRGRETSVQLIQNQRYVKDADLLNNSIQNLEYVLINAIRGLTRNEKQTIGFLQGHGELFGGVIYDLQRSLQEYYNLDYVSIDGQIQSLTAHRKSDTDSNEYSFYNLYDLLIIAKPTKAFSDQDLYILDQYIMYGGKVLWLIDALDADLDSLADRGQMMATRYPLGLDEMLFNYGVRINPNLLMDMRCRPIPIQVGQVGDKPQMRFCPWYYFPEIVPLSQHPIVRNLDLLKTDFVSSIDLIDNDIRKTVLLTTSEYTRVKNAPAIVDLADAQAQPDRRQYSASQLPIAVLLEGSFLSAWRNRLSPVFTSQASMGYREEGDFTKMIVVSDGDIIRNRYIEEEEAVLPLGYDFYTQTMYANKDFLLNAVNYLVGDEGMMDSRSRSIKLRKLDVLKVREQRTRYQVINIICPLLLLAATGGVILLVRRKKYTKRQPK